MNTDSESECYNEISLLICEFMGINIGVDMAQVTEICDIEVAEKRSRSVFYLHEKIVNIPDDIHYDTPRALLVNHSGGKIGIIVDMPREIVSIPTTSVRPLPGLIELFKDLTPIWGVALRQNSVVLLIDLLGLLDNENIIV